MRKELHLKNGYISIDRGSIRLRLNENNVFVTGTTIDIDDYAKSTTMEIYTTQNVSTYERQLIPPPHKTGELELVTYLNRRQQSITMTKSKLIRKIRKAPQNLYKCIAMYVTERQDVNQRGITAVFDNAYRMTLKFNLQNANMELVNGRMNVTVKLDLRPNPHTTTTTTTTTTAATTTEIQQIHES